MNIFLSWSGNRSKLIAKEFKEWIRIVIKNSQPFFSSQDVTKANRWTIELAKQLKETDFGIVLMTKENVNSPWIYFEAGALSSNYLKGNVCTIQFDISESEIQAPLNQFQNAIFTREDILKLFLDINARVKNGNTEKQVIANFTKSWPSYNRKIREILSTTESRLDNVKKLIDYLNMEDCKESSLKQWVINKLLLSSSIEKIKSISSNHLQLHAYDTLDYIAFTFESFLEHLEENDNYFAISTMRFFSKNKIRGGIKGYFDCNKKANINGANINRIIFASAVKAKSKPDCSELINEIGNLNQSLRRIKAKGKSNNEVKIVDNYDSTVDKYRGFGLIKRRDEYLLIMPENVTSKGEKPRIQFYFSNGKGRNFREFIMPCIEAYNNAKKIQSLKI